MRLGPLIIAACCVLVARGVCAQGFVNPVVGPVNTGFGGAGTAAPLDAAGALHWNPATISGLPSSEILVSGALVTYHTQLGGSVPADAFGPGLPGTDLTGTVRSRPGTEVQPAVALVYQPNYSRWTYGLGVFQIGGYQTNFPAAAGHPLLSTSGYGLGNVFSRLTFLQIAPTASLQVTDHLAVGFAPTMTIAELGMSPALFAAPDDANGDNRAHYPDASHSPSRYGLGFQLGAYWTPDGPWSFGASFKSKQWIEEFTFLSVDENGDPRSLYQSIEYPMLISVGMAYRFSDRLLVASDSRFVNFRDTSFFGEEARYQPDGSLLGLGWSDVFTTSVGCQYVLTDSLLVRSGYIFGQSPISAEKTSANIQAGPFWNHAITMGATAHLADNVSLSVAYLKTFDHTSTGTLDTPVGPVVGSVVALATRTDMLTTGVSVQY